MEKNEVAASVQLHYFRMDPVLFLALDPTINGILRRLYSIAHNAEWKPLTALSVSEPLLQNAFDREYTCIVSVWVRKILSLTTGLICPGNL